MKKLIFSLLALFSTVLSVEAYTPRAIDDVPNVNVADARHFTSNPDGILSAMAVDSIDRMLYALRNDNTAEVAVAASTFTETIFALDGELLGVTLIGCFPLHRLPDGS